MRLLKAILVALGMLIVWLLYVWYQITSVPNSEPLEQADVGIVLGAALWGDVPSPGLRERLDQGIKEYNAGVFQYFIVSGGYDTPQSKLTEAEGMTNYLVEHGVPESAVFLEKEATNTYENLKFSHAIMDEHGLTTAIIVTHSYHGRRSLEIANSQGYISPQLSLSDTRVLNKPYHQTREVLAYTKWKLVQLASIFSAQ